MVRFLIYFSYFGTRYSGLQIQNNLVKGKQIATVQGALQDALKRLKPCNDFRIVLSSRTDKGVHSLKNACHVDLECPEPGKEYDPQIITRVMNFGLENGHHDIRVLETRPVNSSFHARLSAQERKYVYRIAHVVGKSESLEERQALVSKLRHYFVPGRKRTRIPLQDPLPVTDACKVRTFRNTLDMSKLLAAAELCSGIHNFSSFTKTIKHDADFRPHPVKLLTLGIKRGQPFAHPLNAIGCSGDPRLEFWDIHVRSRSFLYRQVRRVVGGMALVAMDRIQLSDLKDILDNPRVNFPFTSIMGMDECGLFLVDVGYDPQDLKYEESHVERSLNQESVFETNSKEEDSTSADENHSSVPFTISESGGTEVSSPLIVNKI